CGVSDASLATRGAVELACGAVLQIPKPHDHVVGASRRSRYVDPRRNEVRAVVGVLRREWRGLYHPLVAEVLGVIGIAEVPRIEEQPTRVGQRLGGWERNALPRP